MKNQKTFQNLKAFGMSLACLGLLACKTQAPQSPADTQLDTENPTTIPAVGPGSSTGGTTGEMGSSSGGGGFADESAAAILERSAEELATEIRRANPVLFKGLPEGWTQSMLADVVANVRVQFNEVRERYGRQLVFDYGYDEDGTPYITALRAFVGGFSGVVLETMSAERRRELIDGTKLRLAHELSHHLGFGETEETDAEARAMGYRLIRSLDSDTITCQSTMDYPEAFADLMYDRYFEQNRYLEDVLSKENFIQESFQRDRFLGLSLTINIPSGLGGVSLGFINYMDRSEAYTKHTIYPWNLPVDPAIVFEDIGQDNHPMYKFAGAVGVYGSGTVHRAPHGFLVNEYNGFLNRNEDSTLEIGSSDGVSPWILKYDPETSTALYTEAKNDSDQTLTLKMNCRRGILEFIPTTEDDASTWRAIVDEMMKNQRLMINTIAVSTGWRN